METMRNLVLQVFIVLFSCQTIAMAAPAPAISTPSDAAHQGYVVEGRVKVEGMGARVFPSKSANVQVIWNGGQQKTFVRPDGYFAFQGVTAGTHLIEVFAAGYSFSPVRVDVSARLHGKVRALAVETRRYYSDALVLEPNRQEGYYEVRETFSALALVKTPMGMMVCFMVVALLVLPRLMDSIDPEEMKKVQEDMRNKPAPSFSSLLQGAKS